MAKRLPWIKSQFSDANGNPLAGGKVFSYIAGSSTPLNTYNSYSGLVPNSNPVILDANGEADIYLGTRFYKFVIKDANDVVLKTLDDVDGTSTESNDDNPWAEHAVTDGQSAANLSGETVDGASYSSAVYDFEILRGTTVLANGILYVQYFNSTWRILEAFAAANEPHGVTFSISQATTIGQLRAALDTGAGNGTIKLSRRLVPV